MEQITTVSLGELISIIAYWESDKTPEEWLIEKFEKVFPNLQCTYLGNSQFEYRGRMEAQQ